MAEIGQVLKSQLRGAAMIENNIGDSFDGAMPRDGDGRQGHRLAKQSVDGDQALDAALQQNVRITVEKFLVVVVRDGEKEEVLLAGDNARSR